MKQNRNRYAYILLNLKIVILLTRNLTNCITKKNELNYQNNVFRFFNFRRLKNDSNIKKKLIRKNKIVINIRDFNKIIESNNYFISF